uniref:Grass carp reovirus (GCRV)-induced gene 2p n=1 Tax=Pundamilia nyererei TaxID=303518 RepID=A0A3B4GXY1_9CICH
MSLQFFGWEVTYDDESPSVELTASQAPKDKGVYTMYHGTSIANARLILASGFQQSQGGMLGKGVYVSRDKKKAERYPLNNSPADRVVLKLHVRVGRVKRIDKDNHPMQYTWSTQGYDTAWVPPNCGMKAVPSGLEEDCVFDPKRVTVRIICLYLTISPASSFVTPTLCMSFFTTFINFLYCLPLFLLHGSSLSTLMYPQSLLSPCPKYLSLASPTLSPKHST